jgi:hypothetical protein
MRNPAPEPTPTLGDVVDTVAMETHCETACATADASGAAMSPSMEAPAKDADMAGTVEAGVRTANPVPRPAPAVPASTVWTLTPERRYDVRPEARPDASWDADTPTMPAPDRYDRKTEEAAAVVIGMVSRS